MKLLTADIFHFRYAPAQSKQAFVYYAVGVAPIGGGGLALGVQYSQKELGAFYSAPSSLYRVYF